MSNNDIDPHVRRLVGIATLRRLRRMVDSDAAGNAVTSRRAKQLAFLFAAVAACFVIALALITSRY